MLRMLLDFRPTARAGIFREPRTSEAWKACRRRRYWPVKQAGLTRAFSWARPIFPNSPAHTRMPQACGHRSPISGLLKLSMRFCRMAASWRAIGNETLPGERPGDLPIGAGRAEAINDRSGPALDCLMDDQHSIGLSPSSA